MADNVDNIGRIFVVDPNPPNNETIPLEDLFIYVKFTAYPRSRTTYNGTNLSGNDFINFGVEDEVNFISTKIRYNEDGKLDPSPQQTYATTDWTNISTFGDSTSGGILEGFGIKSISIKYNASLVPQIDITFSDVRGSALFDKISDNSDIKSPYSVFFKLPYPIFRLSIKGYYGQKVDYCLHMVNWTSSFDNNTGNFDISANFLGYQQAILNDMVLGNIIGVSNTKEGFETLQEIYKDEEPIKIDDFLVKLSKLQIDSEIIKSQSDSFEQLKKLNGKLSLLKNIQSFIGKPILKSINGQNNGDESKNYLEIPNDETNINSNVGLTRTGTNLRLGVNYIVIRDYLLVKNTNRRDVKNFVLNLNNAINEYSKYVTLTDTSGNLRTNKDSIFISSFYSTNNEDNWENFINSFSKDNNVITGKTLTDVLTNFQVSTSGIGLNTNEFVNLDDDNISEGKDISKNVNDNFEIESFKTRVDNGEFYTDNFLQNTSVILFDLRLQRSLLEDLIKDIESSVKTLREDVEDEINNKLIENFKKEVGFNPNIKNSFKVIMNNTQAMIQTIYKISKSAEDANTKERFKLLNRYEIDVPTSIVEKLSSGGSKKGISFPSIYEVSDNNESSKEIYIGNVDGVTKSLFPEYDFVERVFDKLVNRREFLKQVTKAGNIKNLDGDNWFPLNPLDYEINPFIIFNNLNDENSIVEELYKTIISRVVLLKNYSNYTKPFIDNVSTFGKFDGINAKNIILNNQIKLTLKQKLTSTITKSNLVQIGLGGLFNNETDASFTFKDDVLKIGDISLTSDRSDSNSKFIELDNSDVINNSKKLWKDITGNETYGNRNKNLEGKDSNSKYSSNNNVTTNCLVSPFFKSISGEIIQKNSGSKNLNNLTYDIINPEEKYINKTNFKTSGDCKFEKYLVGGYFYNNQPNIFCRSYLALSTLPFTFFEEGILEVLKNNGGIFNNSKIIQLPELYVYYIGSLLWRLKTNEVNFNIISGNCSYNIFSSPNSKYLSKIGSKNDLKPTDIEQNLVSLPKSVKEFFIAKFENWTKINFFDTKDGPFEQILSKSSNDNNQFSENEVNNAKNDIVKIFKKTSNLIIFNSTIFNPNYDLPLTITLADLQNYISSFLQVFDDIDEDTQNTNNNKEETKKDKDNQDKLKLQLYNYFKNINDKWISDNEKGFNICGGKGRNLIDYFKFIDRGWNDIGDKASFDLKSFINLGTDLDVSVYLFISKILRDSNFLFQILPNYINYKDSEEVAQMFRPQTTLENNSSSGPIYCCIYAGGNSQALDIGERNNYYFSDDGFKFVNGQLEQQLPNDITSGEKVNDKGDNDFSLVAFRVAFGSQNQSIFKSVSLNQQEHKETAEYFKVLSDTIDKRGATQRSYQGTNLLKLFKTRSYQCSVEAMGCMNIQPLMYFDLQNVPFFNGAYLITNVTHQISPNNMSTSFNGLRQSKYITPPIEDITTSLDVNLDESFDVPNIEFINLSPTDSLYSIGVNNPNDPFDFGNFTVINFRNIGVTNFTDAELGTLLNSFKTDIETGFGIDDCTNAQVCMFIANVLTQSNNLTNREYTWEFTRSDDNNINYYNNVNKLYYDVITNNNNVTDKKTFIGIDDNYLSVQPIFTSTTLDTPTEQISYNPKDPTGKLKDEKKYFNVFPGDAYRYKPRGFLYVIGRKQYFDFYQNNFILENPFSISSTNTEALNAAINVWTQLKDSTNKSSFDYIKNNKDDSGKSTTFQRTVEISQQLGGSNNIEKSFLTFQKVLQVFTYKNEAGTSEPLINFFT